MKSNKYKILFLVLITAFAYPTVMKAQFTINGHVPSLPDGSKIYFDYGGRHVDSVLVKNSSFVINGKALDCPGYCNVTDEKRQYGAMFWVDNGDNVRMDENGKSIHISGAKVEDEYQLYRQHMSDIRKKEQDIVKKGKEAQLLGNTELYHAYEVQLDNMRPQEDSVFIEFLKSHPSSYISLNHIYNCRVLGKYPFSRYNAMCKYLTPGAFKGKQWNDFMEIYHKDEKLQPGHQMPDFALPDIFDTPIRLSDCRGKVVLLTIGSGPLDDYKAMLPVKKKLYASYGKKKLEIIDILLDSSKDGLLKVMVNNNVSWTFVSDYKGWNSPLLKSWGIDHLCQTFVIDAQGKIIANNVFGDELAHQVESLFK